MTDLTKLLAEIQRPDVSHVDMIKRRATCTLQWFLENDVKTHPIHNNNHLEFFMCGQEGFGAIEKDIRAATSSIDLVLWGFDPGMELTRSGNVWPRGTTYGDLLTTKAREGVKVRMLIWYLGNVRGGLIAENCPDIGFTTGLPLPSSKHELTAPVPTSSGPAPWSLTDRSNYCNEWWKIAIRGGFKNLEIRFRKVDQVKMDSNIAKYLPGSVSSATQAIGLNFIPTHHQKPVLIDYAPASAPGKKRNTCGYVMGLNSVTDYWDTPAHGYNDQLRELAEVRSSFDRPWARKPYRDYAIRVQGEALYCINQNFVQGWDTADGYNGGNSASSGSPLGNERESITPGDLPVPAGARCRAQILRTFPDSLDATILKAYTLAAANAVNYIYVENQYFQLADWPRMIKKIREKYCDAMKAAGAKPNEIAPLHMFVVIPQPERDPIPMTPSISWGKARA